MGKRQRRATSNNVLAAIVGLLLLGVCAGQASAAPDKAEVAKKLGYSLTPSNVEPYAVCPPKKGQFECMAIAVPTAAARSLGEAESLFGLGPAPTAISPSLEGSGVEGGLAPSDLRSAYKLSETGGSGQTVAIIDAYNDPNAEADLKVYRKEYGLSECTKANGCFKKINQKGEEANYPANEPGWSGEISIDVDMVSAVCPECKILLVEANNNTEESSLLTAEGAAANWEEAGTKQKVTEISNSWGGKEYSGETSADTYFDHPGIPITASAGDEGYVGPPNYPASSQYVISVGGTELKKAEKSSRGWEESVWEGSSGGCSAYEPKPAWQTDTGCSKRTDNDVAAVADPGGVGDPGSPVSVYDSYPDEGHEGWLLYGGTSVAAPIVAGIEAHASSTVRTEGPEAFYRRSLFDVTSGFSGWEYGACGGKTYTSTYDLAGSYYLCNADGGYDGPTGWGTPDGPLELSAGFRAITDSATGASPNGATLNGYVDPEGLETTYHFEYGPTMSYGTSAPVPSAGVGSGVVGKSVAQSITIYQPGTYHYRLVATNSSGTVYGQDQTFTTVPWAVQKTPSESERVTALNGVSCSSSSSCVAIGHYGGAGIGRESFAEDWNGAEWVVKSTATPVGATAVEMAGVSCSSSSACTAVGVYASSSGWHLLAERWNGTEWQLQSVATPAGLENGELSGVSCFSASACTAVGYYASSSGWHLLAERWNGTEWQIQSTPTPTGALTPHLDKVSCSSLSACTAVGSYRVEGEGGKEEESRDLAENWNGTEWQIETMPNPARHGFALREGELRDVSCSSSNACTAVGWYESEPEGAYEGPEVFIYAERWNGTEWQIQSMPNPETHGLKRFSGYTKRYLMGVSCESSTLCIAVGAVGEYRGLIREADEDRPSAALAEIWNGKEWLVQGTPGTFNTEHPTWEDYPAMLFGVSCFASNCKTVGSSNNLTLAESWALPFVETKAATSVGSAGATLNGFVNSSGAATTYQFEYGTTSSYGQSVPVPAVEIGKGKSGVNVTQTVGSLKPLTEYHFRVTATNGAGTTYGADQTFTTGEAAWSWAVCKKVESGGVYKNNKCQESGSPNSYAWMQPSTGVKSNVVSSGGSFKLKGTVSLINVTIECKKEEGTGWIENPTGGGSGIGFTEAKLKECTVPVPSTQHCTVKEPIVFSADTQLLSFEGKTESELTPVGSKFGEITVEGCKSTELDGKYSVAGVAYGLITGSSTVFTAGTPSKITLGGKEAELEGTSTQEIEGGGSTQAVVSWAACKKVESGGIYTNNKCKEAGSSNSYAWVQPSAGAKSKVVSSGGPFVLKAVVGAIAVTIECKKEEGTGWIENPTGGGSGTGFTEAKFKECTVPVPLAKHCGVKEPIVFSADAQLLIREGKTESELSPIGSKFAEVTIEGCVELAGKYSVEGVAYGVFANSSTALITGEPSKVKFGGKEAELEGTSKQEIEGGGSTLAG